ncbi:hypothetical protein H0H87_011563 [Tephrocybe sp. NHM501043]|nr:hypothetical protein H0H87_011563 [Tephrocybe sp. NHM501043]
MAIDIDTSSTAEFMLLDKPSAGEHGVGEMEKHDLSTAPLITREAFEIGGYTKQTTQYGVLGRVVSIQ